MLKKYCFTLMLLAVGASPLAAQSRTEEGAILGGVAGAIVGGIAGNQNGETPEGIAIGGVVGAITGGLIGRAKDDQAMREYQYQQYQQQQRAQQLRRSVSIGDAISMSRSGLSPNLIVNQVRTNGVQQEIGVQEIITLHENGVPEVVIQEMQKARVGGTTPQVIVSRPPAVVVERRPQVIIESYPTFRHYHYGPPIRYGHHYHRQHRFR